MAQMRCEGRIEYTRPPKPCYDDSGNVAEYEPGDLAITQCASRASLQDLVGRHVCSNCGVKLARVGLMPEEIGAALLVLED